MGKMIKKVGLTTIAISALLLSGCGGGGGGNTDPMNDKQYIIVLTDVAPGICEDPAFTNELRASGFIGLLTRETANNTSCETYNKVNDYEECGTRYLGSGNANCVVGFDDFTGSNAYAKRTTEGALNDSIEIISSEF